MYIIGKGESKVIPWKFQGSDNRPHRDVPTDIKKIYNFFRR